MSETLAPKTRFAGMIEMKPMIHRFVYYIINKGKVTPKCVELTLKERWGFQKLLHKSMEEAMKDVPKTATVELKGWYIK